MVSTRSKTAQSRIEDFAVKNNGTSATVKSSTKDQSQNSGRKRESVDVALLEPKHKRMKSAQSHSEESAMLNEEGDSKPIIINRAPVLQLWSASVINSTYPGLSWETCLSVGSAVSSICAVAKGRSVGKMPESTKSDEAKDKVDKAKDKNMDLKEVKVMNLHLKLKDGLAVVGGDEKGKPGNEETLKKKFGDNGYERVRKTFQECLQDWKNNEDDSNAKAFGFYEKFRPDVSGPQRDWGRKGELALTTVRNTIKK